MRKTGGLPLRKHAMKKPAGVVLATALALTGATSFQRTYAAETPDDWAIYVYMCGSDLESEAGLATEDLREITGVGLPQGVTVVVETGGTTQWQNDYVDESELQRFVYRGGDRDAAADANVGADANVADDATDVDTDTLAKLTLVDSLQPANMGDPETFTSFLDFCTTNYPARKEAVIFWNHGGGSVYGVCSDEIYEDDSLTLDELYASLDGTFAYDQAQPALEMVGFDACLMATVDTANVFEGFAHYMTASQENEPGCGWGYAGWLQALADDPSMDGAKLGQVICDTYAEGCSEYGDDAQITLSVTDLSKVMPLIEAYNSMGKEALEEAKSDQKYLTYFGRGARNAVKFGQDAAMADDDDSAEYADTANGSGDASDDGTSDDDGAWDGDTSDGDTSDAGTSGSYNMVDLGDLAAQNANILPESAQKVQKLLDDCVIYKTAGKYNQKASGLSCYYAYDKDSDEVEQFGQISASEGFFELYDYMVGDEVDGWESAFADVGTGDDDNDTTDDTGDDEGEADTDNSDLPVTINDEGSAVLDVGTDLADYVEEVSFELVLVDAEDDAMLDLGSDNDLIADWDNGVFTDNFRGVWGSLDGNLVHMEIVNSTDDYTLYNVPIKLNGERYQLAVVYDYDEEAYNILGASKGRGQSGMQDRNRIQLKAGDEITTLHDLMSISDDDSDDADDGEYVEWDTFVLEDEGTFDEIELPDAQYVMMFKVADVKGEERYSDVVSVNLEDGYVSMELL